MWSTSTRIRRSQLDGSEVRVLLTLGNENIIALATDDTQEMIYWLVDNHENGGKRKGAIFRATYDGERNDVFKARLWNPIGLGVFENRVYTVERKGTNFNTQQLKMFNKVTARQIHILLSGSQFGQLAVNHRGLMLQSDAHESCRVNQCEHVCLPKSQVDHTCKCQAGFVLNGHRCEGRKPCDLKTCGDHQICRESLTVERKAVAKCECELGYRTIQKANGQVECTVDQSPTTDVALSSVRCADEPCEQNELCEERTTNNGQTFATCICPPPFVHKKIDDHWLWAFVNMGSTEYTCSEAEPVTGDESCNVNNGGCGKNMACRTYTKENGHVGKVCMCEPPNVYRQSGDSHVCEKAPRTTPAPTKSTEPCSLVQCHKNQQCRLMDSGKPTCMCSEGTVPDTSGYCRRATPAPKIDACAVATCPAQTRCEQQPDSLGRPMAICVPVTPVHPCVAASPSRCGLPEEMLHRCIEKATEQSICHCDDGFSKIDVHPLNMVGCKRYAPATTTTTTAKPNPCDRNPCSFGQKCQVKANDEVECLCPKNRDGMVRTGPSKVHPGQLCKYQDINECEPSGMLPPPCSQLCTNTPGHYQCDCVPGYRLTDTRVCRVQKLSDLFVLYSVDGSLHRYDVHRQFSTPVFKTHFNQSAIVRSIRMDVERKLIVWSEVFQERTTDAKGHSIRPLSAVTAIAYNITGAGAFDTSQRFRFVRSSSKPEELAYDHLTQVVYVHDQDREEIVACNMDRSRCGLLHYLPGVRVNGMAIDGQRKRLYYIHAPEHGTPTLQSSTLDGKLVGTLEIEGQDAEHQTILDESRGLTYEPTQDRLYWGTDDRVYSVFVNGTRPVLYKLHGHAVQQVEVFEDWVYFTDAKGLYRIPKTHQPGFSIAEARPLSVGKGVYGALCVMHPLLEQDRSNSPCSQDACPSDHVCVQSNVTMVPACLPPPPNRPQFGALNETEEEGNVATKVFLVMIIILIIVIALLYCYRRKRDAINTLLRHQTLRFNLPGSPSDPIRNVKVAFRSRFGSQSKRRLVDEEPNESANSDSSFNTTTSTLPDCLSHGISNPAYSEDKKEEAMPVNLEPVATSTPTLLVPPTSDTHAVPPAQAETMPLVALDDDTPAPVPPPREREKY